MTRAVRPASRALAYAQGRLKSTPHRTVASVTAMIRLTVLYGAPADRDAFLNHYEHTHVPLVRTMPKVARFTWGLGLPGLDGGDPPYFLNAELCWDSPEDMAASFGSEEGQANSGDLVNLVCDGVTMMVSEGR